MFLELNDAQFICEQRNVLMLKASAKFYASPVIASGRLYAAREDGVVFVAQAEGSYQLLAENKVGERVIASPVPVSNRLLIRGEQHLFCVSGE